MADYLGSNWQTAVSPPRVRFSVQGKPATPYEVGEINALGSGILAGLVIGPAILSDLAGPIGVALVAKRLSSGAGAVICGGEIFCARLVEPIIMYGEVKWKARASAGCGDGPTQAEGSDGNNTLGQSEKT